MLGGKMSNEDEDAVEDELEAMEKAANGVPALPNAPQHIQEQMPDVPAADHQRAKARARERAERRQEAMAA